MACERTGGLKCTSLKTDETRAPRREVGKVIFLTLTPSDSRGFFACMGSAPPGVSPCGASVSALRLRVMGPSPGAVVAAGEGFFRLNFTGLLLMVSLYALHLSRWYSMQHQDAEKRLAPSFPSPPADSQCLKTAPCQFMDGRRAFSALKGCVHVRCVPVQPTTKETPPRGYEKASLSQHFYCWRARDGRLTGAIFSSVLNAIPSHTPPQVLVDL